MLPLKCVTNRKITEILSAFTIRHCCGISTQPLLPLVAMATFSYVCSFQQMYVLVFQSKPGVITFSLKMCLSRTEDTAGMRVEPDVTGGGGGSSVQVAKESLAFSSVCQ